MKKIISVIVLTLILIAGVIIEQVYLEKTIATLNEKVIFLDNLITNAEDINNTEIITAVYDLDEFWSKNEKIMGLAINHNEIIKIGEQIKKIEVYIKSNNKIDCEYELKTLVYYAESYNLIYAITAGNVL